MYNKTHLEIITGKKHTDNRGTITHFNDFDMTPVKRMYIIEHPDVNVVRAWLAHKIERKYFFVLKGEFKIVLVKPDNWKKPAVNLNTSEYLLNESNNEVLVVPGGHAFGFKATQSDSKMIVYSNFNIEDSINDDYRFDKNLWYNW